MKLETRKMDPIINHGGKLFRPAMQAHLDACSRTLTCCHFAHDYAALRPERKAS